MNKFFVLFHLSDSDDHYFERLDKKNAYSIIYTILKKKQKQLHQANSNTLVDNNSNSYDSYYYSYYDSYSDDSDSDELVADKRNSNNINSDNALSQQELNFESSENYNLIELDFAGYLSQTIKNENVYIPDIKSSFFIPFHGSEFGVFISTDSSYAVLTFHNNLINEDNLFLLGFLAFLLEASGYIIVSCILDDSNTYYQTPKVLEFNNFGETHIFAEIDKCEEKYYRKMNITCCKIGYIYLYAHFLDKAYKYRKLLEKESKSNLKIFILSKIIYDKNYNNDKNDNKDKNAKEYPLFYAPNSVRIKDPNFDINLINLSGFKKINIGINLCNIALYKVRKHVNLTPAKISEIGYGTIDSSFFLTIKESLRVPIIINGQQYFVDFRDLHYMNLELYIAEPMYLSKQNIDISIVERINFTYKNYTTI